MKDEWHIKQSKADQEIVGKGEVCYEGFISLLLNFQVHNQAVVLQQALHTIPHPNAEYMTRNVAQKLGQNLN